MTFSPFSTLLGFVPQFPHSFIYPPPPPVDDMIVDPVTLVGHRRVLEFLSKALLVVPSSQHQFLEIVSRELITEWEGEVLF